MKIPFKQVKQIKVLLIGTPFKNFLVFGKLIKNGYKKTPKSRYLTRPN